MPKTYRNFVLFNKYFGVKYFFLFILSSIYLQAQQDTLTTPPLFKTSYVIAGESTLFAVSMLALNRLWYQPFEHSTCHWFNDSKEWLQMDKAGHSYSTYQLSRLSYAFFSKTNLSPSRSIIYGSLSAWAYVSAIECFDAKSTQWGASISDIAANTFGMFLFSSQQWFWQTQHIIFKLSYHPTPFPQWRPTLLGKNFAEQIIKDYNGQTYWLGSSPHVFLPSWPRWLMISIGYSANGLLGGHQNPSDSPPFLRQRQWFISLDIDFAHLPVKNKFIRTLCNVFNAIKIPFPTIGLQNQTIQIYGFYF